MLTEMLQQFTDEVHGCKEYRACAERDPEHADMYRQMAAMEADHARMLADAIERETQKQRDQGEREAFLNELASGVSAMLRDAMKGLE